MRVRSFKAMREEITPAKLKAGQGQLPDACYRATLEAKVHRRSSTKSIRRKLLPTIPGGQYPWRLVVNLAEGVGCNDAADDPQGAPAQRCPKRNLTMSGERRVPDVNRLWMLGSARG